MTLRDCLPNFLLPVAALSGAAALGFCFLDPSAAQAACTQTGNNVECAGVDGDGFISTQSVTVRIRPDALVGNIMSTNVTGRCPLSLPGISVGPSSDIFNEGTISTFGVCAFGVMAGNGGTITNSGTILTHDLVSYGILSGNDVTIRTSGRIATEYQGSGGIFGGSGMRVTVEAGGTVTAGGIGAHGIEVGANALVVNEGAVAARGDASFGIVAGTGSTLMNSGSVETTGNNSIGIQVVDGTLTNAGRIRGVLAGPALALTPTVGVSVVGKDAHFTNTSSGIVEATHIGVRLDGAQSAALSNEGRIDVSLVRDIEGAVLPNGAAVLAVGGAPVELANSGLIVARGGLAAFKSLGPAVALSNSGTIDGDVLFAAGNDVVTYRAGSAINGTVDFGAGEDLLVFQGSGTFAAPILNLEFLSKSSGGNLVLTRDLAVRRQVNIFDGGAITLNSGARLISGATGNLGLLRGAGTIEGMVTNDGVIAPGTPSAKGTLTITGAFRQFPTGTLAVRLSPDGSSDKLLIGGPATLAGTLALSYEGTAFHDRQRFDILAPISGSLSSTGQFTLAAPELAFVKAGLVTNSAGAVAVEIERLSYSTAGVTAAQRSVGRLFDRLQAAPPAALISTLAQLEFSSPRAAAALLEEFAAEGPAGVQTLGLMTLERFTQGLRYGAPAGVSGGRFAWAQGFTSTGRSRGAVSPADFDLQGLTAGVNIARGDMWLGVAAARTDGDFVRGASQADAGAALIALTAARRWDDLGVEAALAYGHGSPDMRRVRLQGGTPDTLTSKAASNLWSAVLAATYEKAFGPVVISPHLGAAYHRVGLSATDEGRALAVRTAGGALDSLRIDLGAGLNAVTGRIRPYGEMSLSVELMQRMPRVAASLIGVPDSSFALEGDARRRVAVDAEVGLAVALAAGWEGRVAGTMTANDLLAGRALTAGLTYRW